MSRYCAALAASIALVPAGITLAQPQATFTGLGDLPGGRFYSVAVALSPDGSVIVGYGNYDSDENLPPAEAFRWTAATGMIGLGDLPGGDFSSFAGAVSPDGSKVYGTGSIAPGPQGYRAFVWDEEFGMRDLAEAVASDYGLDTEGWILRGVGDISDDGLTLVGSGYNPNGDDEGWIVTLPPRCPPDFNGDGQLDLFDFLAFVNLFNTHDPAADCDHDSTYTLFDFLCFTNAFNEGC